MVAYANDEALRATVASGRATFFSRSRGELWEKGKTSGNAIVVHEVLVDCDGDCLIYVAEPNGPSCHTGAANCFFRRLGASDGAPAISPAQSPQGPPPPLSLPPPPSPPPQTVLAALEAELEARKASTGARSYTKSLYDGGAPKIAAKLREEAAELGDALAGESDDRVASEAADVLYHLLVGLHARGLALADVVRALETRMGMSGHEEKASRTKRDG
jgi:phosphoribosyl-ATP pyrophosphohydrolase/phosphoribosyl-AMP cyclohydrolase